MTLHTAAEVARIVGCDESTIRRQAARAWASNKGPGPLAKHPEWRVMKRSAPEGGQGCGWLLWWGEVPMAERSTPPCCEAWESWASAAAWYADEDDPKVLLMPHLAGTRHRFNFCPSCGAERRTAVLFDPNGGC